MNLMQGELNASHLRYRNPRAGGGETTGWTGAFFDPEAGGPGLLVREVLPDSPADRQDVALKPGERILTVGGEEVGTGINLHALLAGTPGTRVPFQVRDARGKKRTVVLKPVPGNEVRRLRYLDWRRQRRNMVESLSDGRLGYIHVQSMGIPSFEEFERDLYAAAHGREGLVIDVRGNGGGWTTDYLLAVLEVRRHARTVPRGGDPAVAAYPQGRLPLAAWTRPAVALCNEESFSNAEIFAHAFKTLGRGLLVGTPTFGGVISTGGTDLVNGGWVRLPLRGWWVAGTGLNMENNGAVPDLVVPQPPAQDTLDESDAQLEAAVRVFLDQIKDDPRNGSW
jgi:tricorn protease